MARQAYAEGQNIHSMTARQLRQYIADQAAEAQERINSIDDISDTSRAFRDALSEVTYSNGRIKKSTSYLSKEEMRELAYAYRQFNSLDTTSGFAKSVEWKENKQRYQAFIRSQLQDPLTRDYWKKYITPKGNISRKGYQDYKEYISFLKSMDEIKQQYGYETIKQYGLDAKKDPERAKAIEKLLLKTYADNKGKGLSQSELNDRFNIALAEYDSQHKTAAKKTKKPAVKKIAVRKPKKAPASKQNIKIKQGRKMRTDGTIREKLT